MSDEHYRKYENDYPGFTNTIRQSLIESALCLIGFSGVDPNFKNWIGWIRDNFKKTNPIFLIECRDIPATELESLKRRNITVINLANCEELKNNYGEALEQFIAFCENCCEANKASVKWPLYDDIDLMNPSPNDFDIQKILEIWKQYREKYPNWFILPQQNRQRLWRFTAPYIYSYISKMESLDSPEYFDCAYELIWRMDKCLMPLFFPFDDLLDIVKRYNPFPDKNTYTSASHLPVNREISDIDLNDIKFKWVEIIFILSRQARLESNGETVDHLLNDLLNADIVSDVPAWETKWYYERGLWELANFNIKGVTDILTTWPSHENLFYESLWQSSLWCELGENKKAEGILEKAFADIRQVVIPPDNNMVDYLHRDTENYILGFLEILKIGDIGDDSVADIIKIIEDSRRKENVLGKWLKDVFLRRSILKKYGCDFRNELSFFNDNLTSEPINSETRVGKTDFFSGQETLSTNIKFMLGDDNIAGFSLPIFVEQSGCPYNVGLVNIYGSNVVKNAAIWLYKQSWRHYSTLMIARLGNGNDFWDSVLSRKEITTYSIKKADEIMKLFIAYLTPLIERGATTPLFQSNFQLKACKVITLFLGRLATICSSATLQDVFLLAKQFYSYSQAKNFTLKTEIDFLWKGAFINRSLSELTDIFVDILKLPIPQDFSCVKDPILYINVRCGPTENKHQLLMIKIKPEIDRLLIEAEAKINKNLIVRLMHLNFLTLMMDNQKLRLAEILWNDINLEEDGLPRFISQKSHLLSLPRLNKNDESKIKEYLLSLSPAFLNKKLSHMELKVHLNTTTNGCTDNKFFDELLFACKEDKFSKKEKYLSLTNQDAIGVYNKLLEWWNAESQSVIDNLGKDSESLSFPIQDEMHQRFFNIPEMLSEVIIPALEENIPLQMQHQIIKIIESLRKMEIPCSSVCLALLPSNAKRVTATKNMILEELSTGERYHIHVAHRSIVRWIDMNKSGFITCNFPKELMNVWESSLMLGMESHFDCWLMHIIDNRIYEVDIYKISLFLDNMLKKINNQNIDSFSRDPLSNIEIASKLAFSVYSYCKETSVDMPDVVTSWKEFASKFAYPSVRSIWEN